MRPRVIHLDYSPRNLAALHAFGLWVQDNFTDVRGIDIAYIHRWWGKRRRIEVRL